MSAIHQFPSTNDLVESPVVEITPNRAKAMKPKARAKAKAKSSYRAKVKPGTVLEREYKGKKVKVTATDDGLYRYGGKKYSSLTAIALEVTGADSISGPNFFSLT
jgi:hypothetical protein